MPTIDISVHQLVDFVLRKGDIDTRLFNSETMQEGTRLHAIYQSKQKANYLTEVNLNTEINYGDYIIKLNGRADGIIIENIPIIDEIKTTNGDLETFFQTNKEWHLGQAICYAYMYSNEKNIDEIEVMLTYISQITEEKMFKKFHFSRNELLEKILGYVSVFLDFYKILNRRIELRNESLKNMSFPFEIKRDGQEEMIKAVQSTYLNREYYFIEASTGIGKTMSAIYGSLDGLSKGIINKIFYLTPKNVGFINSFHALKILQDKNILVNAVEILGKEKMCPHHKEKNCNPDDCPLTRDYYNKLNDVIKEILVKESLITSEVIKEYAFKNSICPFELSLDISLYTDFVVCDYNFAFHPIALLKRFFENPVIQYRKLALIDEAHNLISRARDMYSATFDSKYFDDMKKALSKVKDKNEISKCLRQLTKDINSFKEFDFEERDFYILETLDSHFIRYLRELDKAIRKYNNDHPKFKCKEMELFSRENFKFLKILDELNSYYKILLKQSKSGFTITLFCINPAPYINEKMHNFEGATLFSATLSPIDYFETILLEKSIYKSMELESPFNPNNLKVLVNNKISIKYKDRNKTFNEVVNEIKAFIDVKKGNYMVFAPSFEYLNMLKVEFIHDERFIFQSQKMNSDEKEEFLNKFEENPLNTNVGVCVMGGSFSEGIDLVGDRLIGVVIIGVSMSSVCIENDLLSEYFTSSGLNGFDYAYVNPGISRIMQAVGRVIRKENDKGAALLIDSRYYTKKYQILFSKHWKDSFPVETSEDIYYVLKDFY